MLNRILIAAFIALGFSGAAQAGQVCNETSFMVEAAKAWRTPTGLAVEGWARIAPGGCAEIGPSTSSDQYLYARTTRAYLGGVREWRGSLDICVDETDFAFEGVADCETLGLETRKFRQLTDAERDQADEDDRRGAGEENEVLLHRVPSLLTGAESFTAARMDW